MKTLRFLLITMQLGLPAWSQTLETKAHTPETTTLKVEQLPAPSRDAGDKTYRIVAVPGKAVLYAPAGFVVEVFADNLKAPRWMELTPTGDLLVTENRGSQISILKIAQNYSKAERVGTFANSNNGINRAMGMGFIDGKFLVANTTGIEEFSYKMARLLYREKAKRLGLAFQKMDIITIGLETL